MLRPLPPERGSHAGKRQVVRGLAHPKAGVDIELNVGGGKVDKTAVQVVLGLSGDRSAGG